MSSGVRIKNQFLKKVDLDAVSSAFKADGLNVLGTSRTARLLSVEFMVEFKEEGSSETRSFIMVLRITDEGEGTEEGIKTSFRWKGVSPRDYYHLRSKFQGEIDLVTEKITDTWKKFQEGWTFPAEV